jgi:prolipoprotein diacylglyceryltransferase
MFPILQLGPLALQLPGLFLLAGAWVGSWLIDRAAPKQRISAGILNNLVFLSLLAGILGARLWYAVRYIDVYLSEPLSLFTLNPTTLAPMEGAATGLLFALIYGQRKELPLWPTLDALTPAFAAMSIAFGFAHLSSGDAFGAATDLPWGIELWGASRHPAQVYEIVAGVLILALVLRLGSERLVPGVTFLGWLALIAGSRLFLEAFRGDSMIMLGSIRTAQIVGLVLLMAAMLGLHLRTRQAVNS